MNIILNGEPFDAAEASNVQALIEGLDIHGKLAVEINQNIVPRSEYAAHPLRAGDRVEIVQAVGGG